VIYCNATVSTNKMTRAISISVILAIVIAGVYDNFYPQSILLGVYVSNNVEPVLEGPQGIDTLTLNADNTFKCGAWGFGTYDIKGSSIHFSYEYMNMGRMEKAGYTCNLYRPMFFGRIHIELFRDLSYAYIKKQ